MEFVYKTAEVSALNEIIDIYRKAQKFMERNGNPQWGKGFPAKDDILGGILGATPNRTFCLAHTISVRRILWREYMYTYRFVNQSAAIATLLLFPISCALRKVIWLAFTGKCQSEVGS